MGKKFDAKRAGKRDRVTEEQAMKIAALLKP
jgi:hypothetical protein